VLFFITLRKNKLPSKGDDFCKRSPSLHSPSFPRKGKCLEGGKGGPAAMAPERVCQDSPPLRRRSSPTGIKELLAVSRQVELQAPSTSNMAPPMRDGMEALFSACEWRWRAVSRGLRPFFSLFRRVWFFLSGSPLAPQHRGILRRNGFSTS